jgi:ABC-type transporter Mla MlaB component
MGLDRTKTISIRGPIVRTDLPGLYARVCRALDDHAGEDVEIDVAGVPCDGTSVEALARLELGVRRHRCLARLRNVSDELRELIAFSGLIDVIL